MKKSYADGLLEGFKYLLQNHKEVFVIGQGLWSPWYVGSSMKDLDIEFGRDRIIDSPVSELGVTGAAVGASICGYRPIVVHPRMDFMVLAIDQIVNQAAKWRHMFGNQAYAPVTIRGIINRGGEQGAQHSQALHSWFAHVPGLKVVMPGTPQDARDLLIASVLSDDPVMFIDDRWCYDWEEEFAPVKDLTLSQIEPTVINQGSDITLVGVGYSTRLCMEAAQSLKEVNINAEVVDVRILNPRKFNAIFESVSKTKNLMVIDGGWTNCGFAGEVIASVVENLDIAQWSSSPRRITLTDTPAPTSKTLEDNYYLSTAKIVETAMNQLS